MHPRDAAARGLDKGHKPRVRVFNDYGEVRCRLRLNPDLKPGVTLLPKGVWFRSTESGTNACALAPDTLTDVGAGACFNDARVEVEALDREPGWRDPRHTRTTPGARQRAPGWNAGILPASGPP